MTPRPLTRIIKLTVTLVSLVLLSQVFPVLAGVIAIVLALCTIAYWGERNDPTTRRKTPPLDAFRKSVGDAGTHPSGGATPSGNSRTGRQSINDRRQPALIV